MACGQFRKAWEQATGVLTINETGSQKALMSDQGLTFFPEASGNHQRIPWKEMKSNRWISCIFPNSWQCVLKILGIPRITELDTPRSVTAYFTRNLLKLVSFISFPIHELCLKRRTVLPLRFVIFPFLLISVGASWWRWALESGNQRLYPGSATDKVHSLGQTTYPLGAFLIKQLGDLMREMCFDVCRQCAAVSEFVELVLWSRVILFPSSSFGHIILFLIDVFASAKCRLFYRISVVKKLLHPTSFWRMCVVSEIFSLHGLYFPDMKTAFLSVSKFFVLILKLLLYGISFSF